MAPKKQAGFSARASPKARATASIGRENDSSSVPPRQRPASTSLVSPAKARTLSSSPIATKTRGSLAGGGGGYDGHSVGGEQQYVPPRLRMSRQMVTEIAQDDFAGTDSIKVEEDGLAATQSQHVLQVEDAGGLSLRIVTMSGEGVATFFAMPGWTVAELKDHLAKRIQVDAWRLRLLLGTYALQNDILLSDVEGITGMDVTLVTLAGKDLIHMHDLDTNGVFYFIGTDGGRVEWRNPGEAGLVRVTRSEPGCGNASDAVGREVKDCHTPNVAGAWWCFDLGVTHKLHPSHYLIRHKQGLGCNYLRNWILEAQSDINDKWVTLRDHVNDKTLYGQRDWADEPPVASWSLNVEGAFQVFRIRMTGPDSSGSHHLCCSGFELYGMLYVDC